MHNTTLSLNKSYIFPHKCSEILQGVSYKPVVKSIFIFIIGIVSLRITGLINLIDGLIASFVVFILSSFPILRYIWLKKCSNKMRTMLVSYWPIMVIIYLLTTNISAGSGDGEVFVNLTKNFSDSVFAQGNIWPGFGYFNSVSIIYWFTIYFYSLPYYLFNSTYDAIFPFNCFLLIIVSQLLYSLVYIKSKNEYLSLLTFVTFLFFPGYWMHNLNVERDIVILLQLVLFVIVLNNFSSKHWIPPLFLIAILFFTMMGSRPEYIIVYFFFIGAYILENKKFVNIKPLLLYFLLIIVIVTISSMGVFTQSGIRSYPQIGFSSTLNIFENLVIFPIRVFYSAVGAFPWTRHGIVDAVGHDYIHYLLHIISTIIRMVILLCFITCLIFIFRGKNMLISQYKIWILLGGILISTIQFSSIGYTRYIDPAIVFLIPPTLLVIKRRVFFYFIGAFTLLAGAHFFYYLIKA